MIVQIRHQYDADLKTHLKTILDQSQLGDWFVLYQLRLKLFHFLETCTKIISARTVARTSSASLFVNFPGI